MEKNHNIEPPLFIELCEIAFLKRGNTSLAAALANHSGIRVTSAKAMLSGENVTPLGIIQDVLSLAQKNQAGNEAILSHAKAAISSAGVNQ